MPTTLTRSAAAALLAVSVFAPSLSGAATFSAWQVSDVGFGDTLNVRKYPASTSQKQAAYPNGTVLQMTGRCTGGVDLFKISGQPKWKQRQAIRYQWCEVWHDPSRNENFVTGWVYGKYLRPY
jgi:hypothetical protein